MSNDFLIRRQKSFLAFPVISTSLCSPLHSSDWCKCCNIVELLLLLGLYVYFLPVRNIVELLLLLGLYVYFLPVRNIVELLLLLGLYVYFLPVRNIVELLLLLGLYVYFLPVRNIVELLLLLGLYVYVLPVRNIVELLLLLGLYVYVLPVRKHVSASPVRCVHPTSSQRSACERVSQQYYTDAFEMQRPAESLIQCFCTNFLTSFG